MPFVLAGSWWSLVIRGLIAIACGLIALVWPGITLAALVILFGAYGLLDGVFALIGAVRASRAHDRWATLLLEGISGIVIAAFTIMWPAITALALVYLIGAWALVTGALEIAAGVRLRKYIYREWLLALSGVVSIIFGIFIMALPLAGAIAIALYVGIYSLIFGIILLALGIKLRAWAPRVGMAAPLHAR